MGNPQGHAPLGASEEKLSSKGQCQGTKGRRPRCPFSLGPFLDCGRQWHGGACCQPAWELEGHPPQRGLEDVGEGRCTLPWPTPGPQRHSPPPAPTRGAPGRPQGSAKDTRTLAGPALLTLPRASVSAFSRHSRFGPSHLQSNMGALLGLITS